MSSDLAVPNNPGPRVDLVPAARPTGKGYQIPTTLTIPDAPQDNGLLQLARGLGSLNPALANVAGQVVTEEMIRENAAGLVAAQEAQKKNVSDFKQAQAAGIIPDGASPNFIQSWKSNVLKLAGEKAAQDLMTAYASNGDLRNSDNPEDFDKFAKEWRATRDKATLQHGTDTTQYTPLEIHKSDYYKTMDEAVQRVHSSHINYRVTERERLANETAGNLVMQRLDEAFDNRVDAPELGKVATKVNDVFFNQVTGLHEWGGLKKSKVNELLTEAIITKAISSGDASILDVANHIGPDAKTTLAGTKVFREKAETARQHISTSRWMDEERSRKRAEYRGLGLESPEAVEAKAREDKARIEDQYASEKLHREQYSKQVQKHEATEPEVKAIIRLHEATGDAFSPEIKAHLKSIGQTDPDTYRQITQFLQTEARQGKHVDESVALQTFTKLRAQLSSDPLKFDSREIIKAANRGHITAGQVNELYGLADSNKKTARDFPLMSSPLIQGLRSDLRGAVGQSPLDEFGVGRLRADSATADLNSLIAGYLRSRPKASEYELYEAIQPKIEQLARKHSQDLNESMGAAEKANDPKRQQLDAQLKERYPNKAQREQVINQLLRK